MILEEKGSGSLRRFKTANLSVGRRNRIISNIYSLVKKHRSFLIIGHKDPDEDCHASVVSCALILRKFNKHVSVFLESPPPENLKFLSSICKYNKINAYYGTMPLVRSTEVLCILDTPKPDMIAADGCIYDFLKNPSIPKVELDHHFHSDAEYAGDPDYSLVIHASSTCEILCRLCYKLATHPEIMHRYSIDELYSRNLVLALLTGMLGDAKMGNYLAKKQEKTRFEYFSKHLNLMLRLSTRSSETTKKIASMDRLLNVLESNDAETEKIYNTIINQAVYSQQIGSVILSEHESEAFFDVIEYGQFVGMIKSATNTIAEKAAGIGISAYYDSPAKSNKIQCRIRACEAVRGINLHPILSHFEITDGGGHPGAIAFRLPRNFDMPLQEFVAEVSAFIMQKILV
ncbi:MAG: DHH family phosphoesterase [Treponema sp.]